MPRCSELSLQVPGIDFRLCCSNFPVTTPAKPLRKRMLKSAGFFLSWHEDQLTLDVVECTSCRLVGRNGTLSVVARMKAAKTVEEELRPDLPTTIPAYATLTLQAQELMDQSSEVY